MQTKEHKLPRGFIVTVKWSYLELYFACKVWLKCINLYLCLSQSSQWNDAKFKVYLQTTEEAGEVQFVIL